MLAHSSMWNLAKILYDKDSENLKISLAVLNELPHRLTGAGAALQIRPHTRVLEAGPKNSYTPKEA